MKKLTLILSLIGLIANAYSQSTLIWSDDITTGLSNYYSEYPTIQNVSDTIKVIGKTNTSTGQRLSIVNYDLSGNTISTKTFGNDSVINNTLIDYKFDLTNHVYLLQDEKLGFYKSKIVLQKYSLDGNLIWVEQIYNTNDTSFKPVSIGLINDSCLFVTAFKVYDYPLVPGDVIDTKSLPYIYAYNSNGNEQWEREFNPNSEISHFSYGIIPYNNTALLFGANYSSYRCLVKVGLDMSIATINDIGIENGINKLLFTSDNQLIISGLSYRISKIDLNGNQIWTKNYSTNLPANVYGDEIRSMIQDSAGNIYVTGKHYGDEYGTSNYSNADILTLKYDNNGNLIWQNRYEYGVNNADIGNIIRLKNGQIYVGGQSQRLGVGTDYDYTIVKIDSATGVTTGVYRYDGIANGDDALSSLYIFNNGNVALTGLSFLNSQYSWTTQLLSDVILSVTDLSLSNFIEVYPNPASIGDFLIVKGSNFQEYSLVSSIGQVVQQGRFPVDGVQGIKLGKISSGIYLLFLKTDKGLITRKMIVR